VLATKVLIFGNSASGKSTLARHLHQVQNLAHLDLDSIAWLPADSPTTAPERMPLSESMEAVKPFLDAHSNWVIEGCYGDLIEPLSLHASKVIFMNLSIEQCLANAKNRPWEPHKYSTKAEQDANLDMLLEWISGYENRKDTFSKQEHLRIFDAFPRAKKILNGMPTLNGSTP